MNAAAILAAAMALAAPADTTRSNADSAGRGPVHSTLAVGVRAHADTVRPRRRAVEVSEWYERRLRIHRYGSYTIYPLFALQAIAGKQLYDNQRDAPAWARTGHRVGATALATVFTLNTVTGLWNLWDSRSVEEERGRRNAHALLMLASDAGFTYAGVRLAEQAENSAASRRRHWQVASGSMAAALAGVGVMTLGRED